MLLGRIAEATLSELRSSGSFDIVSCFRRPYMSTTANSYWLYGQSSTAVLEQCGSDASASRV